MKKKAIISFFMVSILLLQACSVQEKMSPQIFFERLAKIDSQLCFDASEQFFSGDEYVCFVSDVNSNCFVFQISVNDRGDCEKISVAAEKTAASDFINCVKSVIQAYAPNDDAENITEKLFSDGKISMEYLYFDSQWHSYSAAGSNGCFYFGVSSKKLVAESEIELSLKQNDKTDF